MQCTAVVHLLRPHAAVVGRVELLALVVSLYRCVSHGAARCRKLGDYALCAFFLGVRYKTRDVVGVHGVVYAAILLVVQAFPESGCIGAAVYTAAAVKVTLRQETAVELLYGNLVVKHSCQWNPVRSSVLEL